MLWWRPLAILPRNAYTSQSPRSRVQIHRHWKRAVAIPPLPLYSPPNGLHESAKVARVPWSIMDESHSISNVMWCFLPRQDQGTDTSGDAITYRSTVPFTPGSVLIGQDGKLQNPFQMSMSLEPWLMHLLHHDPIGEPGPSHHPTRPTLRQVPWHASSAQEPNDAKEICFAHCALALRGSKGC